MGTHPGLVMLRVLVPEARDRHAWLERAIGRMYDCGDAKAESAIDLAKVCGYEVTASEADLVWSFVESI